MENIDSTHKYSETEKNLFDPIGFQKRNKKYISLTLYRNISALTYLLKIGKLKI